jgi:hypothetical protein
MRDDMAKVIVERPRLGSRVRGKGVRRREQKLGVDNLPRREGIKRRWNGGSKHFNEHLGPLRRYLRSQVGRPWSKVFSEICAHINRNSVVQDHVRDHVEDYVERNVILIDGVPCHGGAWAYGKPLADGYFRRALFYVCPRTGLLREVKISCTKARRRREADRRHKLVGPFVRIDANTGTCRVNGQWRRVTYRPFPKDPLSLPTTTLDVLAQHWLTRGQAVQRYGTAVYVTSLGGPLSKAELKQLPAPLDV